MRRVLVSAGDPSGDLILAGIIRHLKTLDPTLEFVGLCGPASRAEGAIALVEPKDVAVVGILEVVRNLKTIYAALDKLKAELGQCDSLLCVDFPDFNLKLAAMARKLGRPVDFVIAPQVWAWRAGRLPKIARLVRRMYPALPFEEEILREAGIDARFMGHPIRDLLPPRNRREARAEFNVAEEVRLLAILPGSRHGEILRHLPLFVDAWDRYRDLEHKAGADPALQAVVPLAPGWTESAVLGMFQGSLRQRLDTLLSSGVWKFVPDSRRALMAADFGWVVSGTASLEAALYLLPHVLVYRLSRLSAWLIKSLSHYFTDPEASAGLPNILLGKAVIPELLQEHLSAQRLAIETFELYRNPTKLAEMERSLRYLPKKLGDAGATRRIAEDLWGLWNPSPSHTRESR